LDDVDKRMGVGVARKKEAQGVDDDADGEDAGAGELPVGFGEPAAVLAENKASFSSGRGFGILYSVTSNQRTVAFRLYLVKFVQTLTN
jgi:hypothetical protein